MDGWKNAFGMLIHKFLLNYVFITLVLIVSVPAQVLAILLLHRSDKHYLSSILSIQ